MSEEIKKLPGIEEEELYEESSALEQAMTSEEHQNEGTFLTGGNTRDFLELAEEVPLDEAVILNPKPVRDGDGLLDFLRKNLHKFDAPYAYIGGEANSPDRNRFQEAELKILIARLSTYESTSLSMSHSLMAQIYQEEPYTFVDVTFLPKPNDYDLFKENGFSVWFGTNSKLAPNKFDVLSITHAVSMEQLNFVSLLHDSGIPLFKQQRMEREDIPILIVGGANSGTTAPLSGDFIAADGTKYSHFVDCVIYGDGEDAAKEFIRVVREGKQKGWTKKQILRACHGRVQGFYEPDLYDHEYDGAGNLLRITPNVDYAEFPVKRATVANLDTVRTLETKILPFTGDGASVDVAIAGSVGCIGCIARGERVASSRGRERIENIQVDDVAVTRIGIAQVNETKMTGTKPTVIVETEWGYKVELTANHEISVSDGWKDTGFKHVGELATGDYLKVRTGLSSLTEPQWDYDPERDDLAKVNYGRNHRGGGATRTAVMLPTAMTPKLAFILGYLAGDGSFDQDSTKLLIAETEHDLYAPLMESMKTLFDVEHGSTYKKGGCTQYTFSSRTLRNFLKDFLNAKNVPDQIFLATEESKSQYVRALFTADGSISMDNGHIYLGNTNKKLLEDVQQLLLDLGIFSNLRLAAPPRLKRGTQYLCQPDWHLYVRGWHSLKNFKEKVGFATKTKQDVLDKRKTHATSAEPGDYIYLKVKSVLSSGREVEVYDLSMREGDASYTVNGISVHNSAGWGACSFCREGSEGPYRERSLAKVMDALAAATKNQGNKEVSFFSLNFNQYSELFPLVLESVKKGFKVGLISQRVDMLAETPEQIRVQRWLKKSNYTLGVEGISGRMRAYLNKNLHEDELLKVCTEMMKEGAGELKLFMIATGMETEVDANECATMMERVNAIREKLGATTRFRISFTPLFPSAFTALQFAPAMAAVKHGEKNLNPIFAKAKELGWGRRLSVSGEEPLVSNTINQGGRNITHLLLRSHFSDNFRFYGNVPKGMWQRWERRITEDPNIDLDVIWGEKSLEYVFPWDDIAYSTSKEVVWRGYMKAVAFQGVTYCLSTRTVKGICIADDEPVLTDDGVKPIQRVVKGQEVWNGQEWVVVKALHDKGSRETVVVRSSSGYTLKVTPEELIKTKEGWKPAIELKVGEDYVEVSKPPAKEPRYAQYILPEPSYKSRRTRGGMEQKPIYYPKDVDKDLAYLFGYFAGDGNLYYDSSGKNGGKIRFCVADHEAELIPVLTGIMAKKFGLAPGEGYEQRNAHTIVYNSTELAHYFAGLNLKTEVPYFVANSSLEIRGAYLRGLFDADGNVHETQGYSLSQTDGDFLRDVQQVLLTMGVETQLGPGNKGWQLRVRAVSHRDFKTLIDFALKAKRDVVVRNGGTAELRQWDQVTDVALAEPTQVWDLEIDHPSHAFMAGGMVVHNCHVNECGCCDPMKTGKPTLNLITNIVGRKVSPVITTETIAAAARSREKAYHLRVLFETNDPIYRFVMKGYFSNAIPRALMKTSPVFDDAYIGAIGHARISAGANLAKDWTFGRNIYDFSINQLIPESELKAMIGPANEVMKEGRIVDIRMDTHMTMLRNDVDFAIYTMFVPNGDLSFHKIQTLITKYFERKSMGKDSKIKVKKAFGKDIFKTVELTLDGQDIRQVEYQFEPEYRGTVVRFVISANYNPMAMLEAVTGRRAFTWKAYPIYTDGYVQLAEDTGETDIFAALAGEATTCKECGGVLEMDLFSGEKPKSGVCMMCDLGQYPVNMDKFFTKELQAVDVLQKVS